MHKPPGRTKVDILNIHYHGTTSMNDYCRHPNLGHYGEPINVKQDLDPGEGFDPTETRKMLRQDTSCSVVLLSAHHI